MFYDYYDKTTNPLREWQARHLYPKFIKYIAKELPENPSVLEIGYGRGDFHKIFSKFYPKAKYNVIDANAAICKLAEENGANICVDGVTMIPPLPRNIENESFDVVVMNNVVEHFLNCQIASQALEELKPILKASGKVVIFFPDYLDWKTDFFEVDYSHSFLTTRYRINRLLFDCGYDVVKNDYFRSAFNCFRLFFWILARINNLVFGFILHVTGNVWKRNLLFKCKIAFNRQALIVAQKK
ncbi:MAG: class I SAM-dependent methyltransferase [Chitinispirillales bacterium]|jgi:SAM-dependent methyltransferase|nr:class I SAM-dependent methyltransferase [Chitinispirillales bacterium]